MKKKSICIFMNNLRGLKIFNKLRNKFNITKIILSKKFLNKDIEIYLKHKKVDFIKVRKINTQRIVNIIKSVDIPIICGFPYIFKKNIINSSKYGIINCHAGSLPNYKGGSPLNWQIINGEKKIGISIIKITEKVDSGQILAKYFFKNKSNYDINKVHEIANKAFCKIILIAIENLLSKKTIKPNKQLKSKYWKQRSVKDSLIIPDDYSIEQIKNLVRALQKPYPYVHFYKEEKIFQIRKIIKTYKKKTKNNFNKMNSKKYILCKDGIIQFK
jgi:methionyl-tRNA formyltransferase